MGKPEHEVIGRTDAEILSDKNAAREVMANDQRIMANGSAEDVEEIVPLPDGTARVWFSRKIAYRDSDGKVIGLLGVSRDITERKRFEQELTRANERLETVLESITDGLAVFDREWRYTYLNDQAAKTIGLLPEQALGKCVWDLFPPEQCRPFYEAYHRAVDTGRAVNIQAYYPEPLNLWLDCHCYPSPDGLSVFFRDISDRKRSEEDLRKAQDAQAFFAKALQDSSQPFASGFSDGRLFVFNDAFARLTGYTREELSQVHWGRDLSPPEWQAIEGKAIEVLHQTSQPQIYEKEYVQKDGTRVPVEIKVHLAHDKQGSPYYYAFVTDIGERRRTQQALIRTEKLASAGRMAATIAHEINNPLDAAMNTVFLAASTLDPQSAAATYLATADEELRRVAHIARQALGFYRETTKPAECDLRKLIESTVEVLQSKLKARTATVRIECSPGLMILGVAGELRQVLANLIGNSLDALGNGGIVCARASRRGDNVVLTVSDNGHGIPPRVLANIFEPFFTTKDDIGTGLGLWVSKQLIDKHGGRIRMRSATAGAHQGTTFQITLPIATRG